MSTYSITIKVSGSGNAKSNSEEENASGSQAEQLTQGSGGSAIKELKKVAIVTGAVAMGAKALNYKTSRVYTETGNRQLQDNINATMQVGGQIAGIVGGFIAGGVAGGVVATAGVMLDYGLKFDSYAYGQRMEATTLAITRERMGIGGMAISRSRSSTQ